MRALLAFLKKECMEQIRSGRLIILGILFVFVGIMNPAIAKLTPWMMEMMADSMTDMGMTITITEVDALTSWTQFFKNIPIALIAFVLLESSIFTREYQSGTLLLALTKGLNRYKVVLAKTILLVILWTSGYWMTFGITYGYNTLYWDNSIVYHLAFATFCYWLFGLITIALMVFFSTTCSSNSAVLAGTAGTLFGLYLLSMLPKCADLLPTKLMSSADLLFGAMEPSTFGKAIVIAVIACLALIAGSIPVLNKKQI